MVVLAGRAMSTKRNRNGFRRIGSQAESLHDSRVVEWLGSYLSAHDDGVGRMHLIEPKAIDLRKGR
jgi:hypothetical protein